MIANDPLALLLHAPMSDEACAYLQEFLSDLAFLFEGARFAQIRRHHQSMAPAPPLNDPEQLELFPDNPPF